MGRDRTDHDGGLVDNRAAFLLSEYFLNGCFSASDRTEEMEGDAESAPVGNGTGIPATERL